MPGEELGAELGLKGGGGHLASLGSCSLEILRFSLAASTVCLSCMLYNDRETDTLDKESFRGESLTRERCPKLRGPRLHLAARGRHYEGQSF